MAFLPTIGGPELLIILVVVLLLFGPSRLPQLGKSLGKTMKAIRDGVDGKTDDEEEEEVTTAKAESKSETSDS